MVRETRHLWVGNLPENIREDRIREHFKRYGRVQSVKLLPRGEECPVDGGSSSSLGESNEGGSGSSSGGGGGGGSGGSSTSGGAAATVAFMDIKSAAKAHATEHTLDERALTTQYYEPQHLQHRFPSHGSSEDHGSSGGSGGGGGGTGGVSGGGSGGGSTGAGVGGSGGGGERGDRGSENFDSRGSHGSFYGSERSNRVVGTGSGVVGGGGSGGGGVGSHSTDPSTGDPGGYISRSRPPPTSSYHVTSSRARDRLYPRTGPYVSGPPPPPHLDRHRGSLPPSSWSAYEPTSSRYGGAPPPPSPATNDAYQDDQGGGGGGGSGSTGALRQHKKQRRKSRSGSSSPSGSSRSGSSSSSRSGSSGGSSSGGSTSPGSSPHRTSNVAVTEDRRPLAICVRNLPARSSDTSLKDGLFHEYKKHGKVTWVKVVGAAGDRYALVCFKKPEDVEKALEVSQDKLFFGCKIEVAPYQGYDVEDNEFRPYEAELDEYHPKATRTLFIGNLEKDVTASELRKHFEPFGEIIEIDIKKQGAVSSYAFCQYSDIGSVVKAMRSMDGEHLGANRIKLGFGKSMPTSCVWVDGIGDCMSEKYLNMQFHQFGPITQVVVDRERGHALVFFDQISCAQAAVKEMRGAALRGRRLQVDFASRECQETFYEHLERQGNVSEKPWDSRPSPASSFDVTRERSSFDSAVTVSSSSNRFTRYDTPPRSRTANYSRTSGGSTPGASPAHPTAMSRSSRRSYQDSYYDGDYAEPTSRRFRSYDEFSQGSGASHDDYQSSVLSDSKLNDDDCPPPSRRHTVQSVVTSVDPPAPPPPLLPPPDIRHLQKERVHLLEQLEECHSSGDEIGFVPKKRAKLDSSSTTILCEDDEPEIASILVTSHSSRKGMDFRRVSDSKVVVHHSTRRGSCEGRGPGPCKRRRDATSRHHEHHDGSRPGTPLVDERPENLVPSEPRRFRERSHEGPLSLPLPRFAAQMLNNNNNTSSSNNNNGSSTRSSSASLAKVASPPCASLSTAPSPRAAPQPPASPPPRHTSSSPTSSDSETAPQSPSLEERIRSLDEKYEKWSGSRALSAAGGDALAKLDASASERFRFRHKLLDMDLHEVQPSDIVKSVLAKRSVFDEDSKRLENFSEKYEPREFTGVIGVSSMIGSTAGLTTSGCTSKVCLQYPFPSHPPVQPTSGISVSQVGINTSLSASLTATTTSMAPSMLKTDPRIVQHNCIHPTPATPITPGTSIKTVSPELPPVSLPIGLISGTAASSGNGSGLASASSLLSNNGSIGSIHTLGASTHRGLSISATTASPTVTAASTDAFSTAITPAVPVATTSSTVAATTTMSVTGTVSSMTTTSSIAPPSSITSSSNSSSSSSLSTTSTDLTRSRLKKETSGSSRESRDSRDGKDGRESKHNKGKDCQRRSRKEEADVERNRKDKDESLNVVSDMSNTDNHNRDIKENKELRYERKEREEKERRDKEDRDRQERRDKEERDRQEKKEKEERERREKDEERREKERQDKERQEKDRKEREERERERKEREENELKEKERREKERIERERREREEKERQERKEREERERREREERERKEREIRLEREKQEKERLKKEREEQERREKEERDRLERERRREEKERLERERKREREEKERLERERRKEKEEREKMEKEKREKEERERLEKLEREKHEREKRREREDQERREKEKAEREKRRDREEKDKEKRERDDNRRQSTENHLHPSTPQSQNQVAPAPVPIKRRCSSQDCPTDEDAKRVKLSDHRRDSKDRSKQNRRSEDRKHRNDSHRSSRESRESRDSKESTTQDSRDGTHGESTRENNSRESGNKEKQRSKKNRSEKESRERSPRVSHESDKEFLSKLELSKRNDSSPSTEQSSVGTNHRDAQHHQQQQSTVNSHSDVDDGPLSTHEIQVARNPSATDTDSDEPKKHSIFDIVDDEPAYISMYDKVKARSTKNMQKLEEEKRQVRLKDQFSQLKQSRARREEKKQCTSWDGDSVSSKALTEDEASSESDSTRTKSLSRKGSRSRIHSDTSEEEEPFNNKVRKPVKTERFLESDVDLGFADTEEKQNPLETSNVIVNSVHTNIKEEPRTSDEDERVAIGFRTNHPAIVVNNHERDSRKKSHKKKQKRQKNSISSEDNLKIEPNVEHKNKADVITSNADCRPNHGTELTTVTAATTIVTTTLENAEERMRADKKQRSKKEKRRDRNGEDKAKARRKRLNRQEARDSQRMEDIFGPLSDDVDDAPPNTFFNRFGNMTSENSAYASDSDGGRSSLDMDRVRRKTEKKRRHQPEDENSVDLAEAGREIEAKLLRIPSSPKTTPTIESNDHDVFRFTDDNDSVEPSTPSTVPEKVKEKKKKRKKSKEERSRKDYHHHHHHHHHHHEKSSELPYLGAEPSPPRASSPLVSKTISPNLSTSRETLLSPIPKMTTNVSTVPSITSPVVTSNIQTPKSEKKKDKLIPGFGIEIDETIHENAVKSISEPEERDNSCQSRSGREEPEVPVPTTPPAQNEDKPRVAISQEETEDAVAALLEETFGASTEDFSYEGEEEETEADGVAGTPAEAPQEDVEEMQQAVESLNASTGEGDADMKPDTPQSEHDLQIDTDTEEDPNYETVDLTQPPKTPDIPSFYKSPTKTLPMAPILTTPEKSIEVRLPPTVTKPQSPPPSVIAHSWSLNEHNKAREPVKPHQLKTSESDTDVTSPERTAQVQRTSASPPPPQYKQPMLVPCSVPISDVPKPLSVPSSRPSPITVQPLYQRLPVSPQSQMVPMRQASPKMQNVTTVSSSNATPLPPLVPSRMPPLVPSQPSPRVSQPLSPNGQWSRNPTLNPHVPNVGKRKPSPPPPTKIAVCVPIPAHRPETPVQQIYSTAVTQQPVIQHASGMVAPAPGYPRGGLPPLTVNIPPRPYMPVPPLASGIQVKSSRDVSGKSVIETLLPVNPNEPQRLDEPKLSPAVIPEPTNKASTSPKVPSPNQPPTYIPETAKIEINASTSSPVFGKPYITDSYTMSPRTQKQISVPITTDSNLLSPRQKQEVSNLQLLTTHVPRSSTPSPVIVAHGHLLHKSVHSLGPQTVSSSNQPLIKTVVPIVPQQVTPNTTSSVLSDKCVIPQTPVVCQRQSPVTQSQVVKSHIPLVSTVSQTIITRVVPSTVSSMSTPPVNEQTTPECLEPHIIQGQQLELDAEAQINQTAQPMQLTPPIQSAPIDEIKKEPADVEQEETMEETTYNVTESEMPLNPLCIKEEDVKQEKQEVINTEIAPCVPKVEPVDTIVPKLETETPVKLEPTNEIKEEEAVKETDEAELDEEPGEDLLKEPSTDPLAIDSKEDPIDSKEDSDYWSAKEVNIESVIKKVDALCDGEGNDGDDEAQQGNESMNSDSHDTSKHESDWFDAESTEGESKKNFVTADDQDESVETCENECTRSRRGRTKNRRGSRGGVTTRRGGRNASAVSHRRGGRSSRGSKHHVEKNKLPADVYEFHDDSEEDNAGRPRLILTIKSPGPNVTGPNAQPATPVAAVKEVPPEEFVSPAANTRKSRRLAERDGSRNTIDDVIEDVVRGSPTNKGLISGNAGNVHATRRSTRHNNVPRSTAQQSIVPLTELRKSPRGSRKAARRTSENNDDSGEEKAKEVTAAPQETPIKEEPKLIQPESPKVEEPIQTVTPAPLKTVSHEPMTLIDPVTGMLIPMRESEEGQYIPVSTSSGQVQTINRTLVESRSSVLPGATPTNEAPRTKLVSESSVLVPAEPKKEAVIEHASCQPTPTQQQIQPQTSVITKPQSPAVQVTSITVAQSSTTGTTIVTTVTATTAPTTTAQPISTSSSQTKPTSLKAHVLNASKLVTSAQQQVITKPVVPSLPNQTIVQNIVKPPAQAVQGLNLQIPPGRVVSPSLSPRAKQAPLTPTNGKQGQPMSPVLNNTGAPPNPKQHLLQAAKQQTSTIVNMPQKLPMNIHPASVNVSTPTPSRIHQPQPTALKGINGQPHPLNPKTHLLQAVVPPIGTVASSPTQPHLVNPQISTVVNSVRPPGPKAPTTGPMEPQKVEVPMSGCIMVPTASPQSRSVPMPTYEPPLHGSTGATPPGGQYGLVPPHRSQSPPLPPPAHHHANTSQSEVVNHYGGLVRDHYLHSQMFQYQYLRAQQEALTAPRITYHIPGTRSPHVPLDPKLEPGIEDSHSPPLELRRGTRTPQDRTTDSPQIAHLYGGMRPLPPPPSQYTGSNPSLSGAPASARAGYGYEPPPAHLRSQYPVAGSEAPPEIGRAPTPDRCRKHQVVTPPLYASQVPPQADSFQMLLQRHPVMWQGLLALKNDQAAVQMHFVFGNPRVARDSLPCNSDGSTPPLRIAQRMRLEQTQVEGVARKMQTEDEHCMLLALPCGRDEVDVLQQSKNLQAGFIMYLQQKQAAGIVNIAAPGSQQAAYVVHIFPSCDFAHETLARIAPDLHHRVAKIAHLLIVIATV
ncbi:PREDICTED: protein split ends-like isoform X2 [Trachymyrmex cornetzi]|uniref:protein split ends-like isoform X2 n=1 Tax=Trachymyrmex cornetzi TaxID=471704 RepID=UPI00084F80C3|nr:PREDICTED: protein split ends-like isoform X2 [Trachymyrmex cornetzi]